MTDENAKEKRASNPEDWLSHPDNCMVIYATRKTHKRFSVMAAEKGMTNKDFLVWMLDRVEEAERRRKEREMEKEKGKETRREERGEKVVGDDETG